MLRPQTDRVQNDVRIERDVIVWDAEHKEVVGAQPSVPCCVRLRIVHRAVGLDDEAARKANEVYDERTYWDLASEFKAFQAAVAQQFPKFALVERRGAAHALGM